jgi:hypothetical protein
VGIRIGEVAAVDQDEGANAEIDYAIIREWKFLYFGAVKSKWTDSKLCQPMVS